MPYPFRRRITVVMKRIRISRIEERDKPPTHCAIRRASRSVREFAKDRELRRETRRMMKKVQWSSIAGGYELRHISKG